MIHALKLSRLFSISWKGLVFRNIIVLFEKVAHGLEPREPNFWI